MEMPMELKSDEKAKKKRRTDGGTYPYLCHQKKRCFQTPLEVREQGDIKVSGHN